MARRFYSYAYSFAWLWARTGPVGRSALLLVLLPARVLGTANSSVRYFSFFSFQKRQSYARHINCVAVGSTALVLVGCLPRCRLPPRGGELLVSSPTGIGLYDSTTGAAINASLIPGVYAYSVVVAGNVIYTSDGTSNNAGVIGEYALDGTAINSALVNLGSESNIVPPTIAVSGGDLFVVVGSSVAEYDATSGARSIRR